MKLYDHPMSANCLKPRLLLAQLGTPYERVTVDIFDRDRHGQLARNPTKLVPVLETDDGAFIPESGAIMLYLAEGTPFLPPPGVARARVHQWLFFEQNQLEPGLAVARFMKLMGLDDHAPEVYKNRLQQGQRALNAIAHGLSDGRPFLAGEDYTVADMQVYAYSHTAADVDLEHEPVVADWLARVEATPGFVNDLEPIPPRGAGT
ncbi:glutathione S-transferase family protein [Solirubrobacter sp. CPCC 204708]|uniref:Glutathione S-transferase family protein n=1 Tax=Solirubrobacter deserti TaxID=2282478 RepID=A0ABT4RHI3_9ACTN|nr:glutathione S-transferase family protein [Solirubrobacter deserti]MBE2316474.1 glutathione S-transferase family protein [Solirubrobacter deserti]MDA0138008.1 glutathione S-transferase family protein [Solirubrobacter deserti]